MRAYTRAKISRTKLKNVSVSVSLGEINSENKKLVRVSFSVARVSSRGQANQTKKGRFALIRVFLLGDQ